MKRLLSALLCTAILCTTFFVPSVGVYASTAYTDYVPGEKPESMLTVTGNAYDYDLQYFVNTGGNKTALNHNWQGQYFDVTSSVAYDGTTAIGRNDYMLCGGRVYNDILTTPAAMETNYVVSFWAKNNTEYETYVNFAPTVYKQYSISQYTKEYGEAGMRLTGSDWQEFKGTISIGSMSSGLDAQPEPVFCIGLSTTALTGTGATFSYNATGTQKMYLAEEAAYDITNTLTSSSAILTTENSASFEAEVVNQIGLPGYLDQTFTWKALDTATRSTEIDGIVITPSDDTRTATVSIAEGVEPGTYDIVAYNATYNMAKGYTVTVDVPSKYLDYVPGAMPENMIGSVDGTIYDLQYLWVDNGSTNTVSVKHVYADGYATIKSSGTYDGSTLMGKHGYRLHGACISETILTEVPTHDTNYVIKFAVRKSADSPANPKVAFVAHNSANYSSNDPTKNYGANGLELTSTDWTMYKDTLHIMPKHAQLVDNTNVPILETVFADSSLAGTSFDVSWKAAGTEEFYLAKEEVYDITNTLTSDTDVLKYGEKLTLKAEVVNQIGLTGYLKQNFTWKALDKDTRKLPIDGITVTPSKDTTSATVTVDSTVPAGEYAVVAYSNDYEIAKGFVVTVEKTDIFTDYVPGSKPQNLMPNNADANNFTGRWLATFSAIAPNNTGGIAGAMRYPIEASPQYWGDSSAYILAGGELTDTANNNTGIGNGIYNWKANTNYVIATDLKNNPASSVTSSKFGYLIYSKDSAGNVGRVGKLLDITSNTDWQTFKFVLHNVYAGDASTKLHYGYPNHSSIHNPQGTDILHRLGSFYIAEEKPYAINVAGTETTLKAGEGSLSFSAEILNQLEIPYEGTTNIQWCVMNEYRTKTVSGFNVVASADGKSVTLSAPETVAPGKYTIVAEDSSLGVAGFRKGMEITITPHDVDMTEDGALVYVAPYGDDDNYGTKAEPLASFEAALSKIEELKARDIDVAEVIFRGGDYRINSVNITDAHSGTEDKSIVFRSYDGEKAVFKGSVELDMSKADHVTDTALLNRMYPKVHDKVVVIDLEEQGISQSDITELTDIATIYALKSSTDYNTIYVDGVEQPIAQWPNGREYSSWTPIKTWSWSSLKYITEKYQIGYADGEAPDRWAEATQWWTSAFHEWDYSRARLSPASIDTSSNVIHFPENETYPFTSTVSQRWKAYNLLEEIDLPGEFYIDRANMLLYFYLPQGAENSKVEFSTVKTLLVVSDASNITFEDLHFTQNLSTAVVIRDVVNVDFDGCSFTNIGYKGLVNSGTEKPVTGANYWQQSYMYKDSSYNCDVRNCVFDNCGGVSLQFVGGDNDTLTPSGNIIENNIITRSNQRSLVDAAMLIAGVGNTVRNNNVSKSTQHAITMIGNDHLVEKNEIHTVLREVADAGAIYQGRNQMMRGSTISTNLIHDIWPADSRLTNGTVGVYMDDCHQGNTIKNNFFIDTKTGYNSHGAAAMNILNNIMVGNNAPWKFHYNPGSSTTVDYDGNGDIVRSTMYDTDKHTDTMDYFVSEIADIDLYRERYPLLADWIDTNKNPHSYTVFNGNVAVDSLGDVSDSNLICEDDLNHAQIGTNPTDYTKDIFVDPDNMDYRIKSDSELATAIPGLLTDANFSMDSIGLLRTFGLSTETSPFKLIYPELGSAVSASGLQLNWEDAFLANRYDVTVASDKDLSNVVATYETQYNVLDVTGLTPGLYYWRVTAKNTSRDLKTVWESEVSSFYVTDIILTNTAISTVGNVSSFSLTVTNESGSSINTTLYVAAYDASGRMRDVQSFAKTISASDTTSVSFDTKGEYNIDHVKIFTWKNGEVTPLRSVKVLKK